MAKLLYVGTHATDDPTRATFPFLMAKGAIEAGHEAGIIQFSSTHLNGMSSRRATALGRGRNNP